MKCDKWRGPAFFRARNAVGSRAGHSQTVLPLPDHATPDYGVGAVPAALEDDPVYKRHPDDWRQFHTRYVTPGLFLHGTRLEP